MKERQLIGMVEYTLRDAGHKRHSDSFVDCCNYAHFLNQPLTLGMFVPCDDLGVPIQEPEKTEENQYDWEIYLTAKERVIFEGALINGNELWIDAEKIAVNAFGGWVFKIDSMEDLKFKTLTESTYNKYFK